MLGLCWPLCAAGSPSNPTHVGRTDVVTEPDLSFARRSSAKPRQPGMRAVTCQTIVASSLFV